MIWILLRREWTLLKRHAIEWLLPLILTMVALSLFPFIIGPQPSSELAIGVSWFNLLWIGLYTTQGLFDEEWADGSLHQLFALGISASLIFAVKCFRHWCLLLSIAFLMVVILKEAFQFPLSSVSHLWLSFPLLLANVSVISALSALFTLSTLRYGLIGVLLFLPLMLPLTIFLNLLIQNEISEMMMLGIIFLELPVSCWLGGLMLRVSVL